MSALLMYDCLCLPRISLRRAKRSSKGQESSLSVCCVFLQSLQRLAGPNLCPVTPLFAAGCQTVTFTIFFFWVSLHKDHPPLTFAVA